MPTEFEQAKEQRREQRAGAEQVLKHGQMKKFKREVRDVILTLVNEHGVEYRLQKDGQHIFLYSGARGERPFKVAASRPPGVQMRYLVPWIREHFPQIDIETGVKKETAYGAHLFDPNDDGHCKVCGFQQDDGRAEHFVDSSPEKAYVEPHPLAEDEEEIEVTEAVVEERPKSKPPRKPLKAVPEWEQFVYPSGKVSTCFEVSTDGEKRLRCTFEGCDYAREGSFAGVHMHEAHHTGEAEEMLRKGVESRKANAIERQAQARAALSFLADSHGFLVVTKEEVQALADAKALVAENERLRALLDELQAKFDLAREAFGL